MTGYANTQRLALGGIFFSFFTVLALSICLILGLVYVGSYSMDKVALKSSVHLAKTAFNLAQKDVEKPVYDLSYWDQAVDNLVVKFDPVWADDNIGAYLSDTYGVTSSHVIDAANGLVYGMIDGERIKTDPFTYYSNGLEKLIARARAGSPTQPPVPATGILKIDGAVSIVSANVLTTYTYVGDKVLNQATRSVLVIGKRVDTDFLAELTENYQLNGLKVSPTTTKPETAFLPLVAVDETLLGYLSWQEETPGTDLLKWIAPLVAGSFMIVSGLVYVFVRRTQKAADDFRHEVSERKRVEKELVQLQRMKSLGNLAGGLAHNLNNLLIPILALSEMSLKQIPKDSSEYENLKVISRAGQSAKEVVEEVMAFSHRIEAQSEYLDIYSVIEANMGLLRSSVPKTITINENLNEDTGIVYGDSVQISSILMNLVSNAVDAIDSETGEITISLTPIKIDGQANTFSNTSAGLENGNYARLTVADTGRGMEKETLERMFEPFYTTKEIGKGTGLGLSSVQGFVANHSGGISVTSTPDSGSQFEVLVPLIERTSIH